MLLNNKSLEERVDYYYLILKKYNLSDAVGSKFLHAYNNIVKNIYEAAANIKSGFITPKALSILNDKMLDRKEKTELTTNEHIFSPQTRGYFICDMWFELFSNNLDYFFKEMTLLSTTIISTVEENNIFKKFTINSKETEGRIRLRVKTEDRYPAAGVHQLWSTKDGRYINGFPFDLSDEFLKYEKDYLLI